MLKQARLSSVSEPLLKGCGWSNDGSINWVVDTLPENIQELVVNEFDVKDDENRNTLGKNVGVRWWWWNLSHRKTQDGHLPIQSQ